MLTVAPGGGLPAAAAERAIEFGVQSLSRVRRRGEARVGQNGTVADTWARCGTRPRTVQDTRFKRTHLSAPCAPSAPSARPGHAARRRRSHEPAPGRDREEPRDRWPNRPRIGRRRLAHEADLGRPRRRQPAQAPAPTSRTRSERVDRGASPGHDTRPSPAEHIRRHSERLSRSVGRLPRRPVPVVRQAHRVGSRWAARRRTAGRCSASGDPDRQPHPGDAGPGAAVPSPAGLRRRRPVPAARRPRADRTTHVPATGSASPSWAPGARPLTRMPSGPRSTSPGTASPTSWPAPGRDGGSRPRASTS